MNIAHDILSKSIKNYKLRFEHENIYDQDLYINKNLLLEKLGDLTCSELYNDLINPSKGFLHFKNVLDYQDKDFLYPTALCSLFARPIKAIERLGLWIKIDVDLNTEKNRSGGDGFFPLHTDLVNTENPPDFIALLCIRKDPLGGGQTVLSNIINAFNFAIEKYGEIVLSLRYKEGQFFGLKGVGKEYNPFPLIEKSNEKIKRRFTSRLLKIIPDKKSVEFKIAKNIDNYLTKHSFHLMLEKGDLLIVNQAILVHGRTNLGTGQNLIPYENRRLLHQAFLREYPIG